MEDFSNRMINDNDLIAACRRKEMRARKELYESYAGTMLSLCARYVGDREVAKDILQDGFYKIFTKIDNYSGKGSFEGWMKRIFINTALEYLKKKRFLTFISKYEYEIEDTKISVFDELTADDLHKCISELPDGFRTIFNLYAVEGYSHVEIAKMLNIKEVTSRSQFLRARNILKEKIKHIVLQENAGIQKYI
jgi:RNA polymerase sigma-70 factor (ECF subfamily)